MTRTRATRTAPFALAAALTLAMLAATSAIAGHQYRVAAAAQERGVLVTEVQHVTVVGRRISA